MDDRELLAAIGEALHKGEWKAKLARDLAIDDRSLRRWVQTNNVPPPEYGATSRRFLKGTAWRLTPSSRGCANDPDASRAHP